MTDRDSRYRDSADVVRTDEAGRELVTTTLRRRPHRTGTFHHLLRQGERLDHLGQQYYRRPHRWWEICDANPGVLSPLQLVGAEPVRQARMSVPTDGAEVPWHAVLTDLRATPGVDRVSLVDATDPTVGPGPDGTVTVLTLWFNEHSTSTAALAAVISAQGPTARLTVVSGPEGTSIIVPPPSGRG